MLKGQEAQSMSIHFDSQKVQIEEPSFHVEYYLLDNPGGCGIRLPQSGPGDSRQTDEIHNLGLCRPFAEEILRRLAEGKVMPGLLRETVCELLYCKV